MTSESTHSSTTPTLSSTNNGPHVYLVTMPHEADAITATGPHVYLVLSALNSVAPIAEADMKEHNDGLNLHLAVSGEEKQLPIVPTTQAQPFKMLISYHYYKKVDIAAVLAKFPTRPMVFADSGAFSAYSQGADVKVADYAAWLKQWESLFTTYVNLDVIRDAKATAVNQRYLENQGLNPIPVVHTGTDLKVLDDMAKNYGYIALGGMVGVPGPTALKWTATCFKRVQGKDTVFHGFGQTRNDIIQALPWFSVDSSSWGMGHRIGRLAVWTGRKFETCGVGDAQSIYKVASFIRKYGGDPEDLADRSRYHRTKIIPVAANSWRAYEQFLRKKHGAVPLPTRANKLHHYRGAIDDTKSQGDKGLHLHLAEGSIENLLTAAKGETE